MKTAMILAAGRGERLRPLTDTIPKALCLVHGQPLIVRHVINLAKAGFTRIVINHAWLGGEIRQVLGNGEQWQIEICYSPEPPGGLETGGGIFQALSMLGDEPFLTVNADIYTDYDFSQLSISEPTLAKVVLVPTSNLSADFGIDEQGHLKNTERTHTFAGIACYRPSFFSNCQYGRYSVTPTLRDFAKQQLVDGVIYQGLWIDIGSPERLQLANMT